MDNERLQQRLNSETSKQSINVDNYIKINLDNSSKLMPNNDILKIIDVGERFNIERQNSKFYRIVGTINPIISNVLTNLDDSLKSDLYTLAGFNSMSNFLDLSYPKDKDNADNKDNTFPTALDNFLTERDGWIGYFSTDINESCKFYDLEPTRERFNFIPDVDPFHGNGVITNVKNWELTITYPSTIDDKHSLVNGGLLIIDTFIVNISEKQMTAFAVPCRHNLLVGDIVRVVNTNGLDDDYIVTKLGDENNEYKDYIFVVDTVNVGSITTNSRFKKLINDEECVYYFRKFKKIKTKSSIVIEPDDYEIYNASFSQNLFNDRLQQFIFNEDIDITDLKDNLGRPLSQLYLTIIKTNSNNLFSRVSSGLELPFFTQYNNNNNPQHILNLPVIQKIHNGSGAPFTSFKPLETTVQINDNDSILGNIEYYGDLVEYNKKTLEETTLEDVHYRFNTLNRETNVKLSYIDEKTSKIAGQSTTTIDLGPRQEGYYYKAHYLTQIRNFSNYVEQGDSFTLDIPSYAVNLGDGRIIWRDLLDIGQNDSDEKALEYPFLNGSHYLYQNYIFKVKRQDPFGVWNLLWSKFPADFAGSRITDRINSKGSEDVC